jgi:hypothetical protein
MPCGNEQGQPGADDTFKKLKAEREAATPISKKVVSEIPKIGTSPLNMRPFAG